VTDASLRPTPRPRRRARYSGTHPKRFEEKYKEHHPERYPETAEKVLASGKTLAGSHRPIMVAEILEILAPRAGDIAADCTLGYGGHAQEILARIQPGGRLVGIDVDPLEFDKTEARLRVAGFGPDAFVAHRSNFAGLAGVLAGLGLPGADIILADLGVSSMQLDDPSRGFSVRSDGPLDMRMNPQRGRPASALLERLNPAELADLLVENADEPRAALLAGALAGCSFETTRALAAAIQAALGGVPEEQSKLSVRRVFQALRIAVNDEFSSLDALLRVLPQCLNPGGRAALITFIRARIAALRRRLRRAIVKGSMRKSPAM